MHILFQTSAIGAAVSDSRNPGRILQAAQVKCNGKNGAGAARRKPSPDILLVASGR